MASELRPRVRRLPHLRGILGRPRADLLGQAIWIPFLVADAGLGQWQSHGKMMGITWDYHAYLDYHGVIMVMKKNELYPLVNEQFANSKITIKLIIMEK